MSPTPKLSSVDSKSSFVDDSTDCAICFDSLDGFKPVITLQCGHKWHRDCIVQQIKIGSMTASNEDKRLLFNGCQCGKCGAIFGEEDHPDLPKDLLRSTDKLRSKVHKLIDEHNLLERVKTNDDQDDMSLYKEAMRKYAFYLCSHCKDPYFGGTIACADGQQQQPSQATPEQRLCPACAPQSQQICQNPSEHGRYLTWKCRYCCKPSTHVCYGNVHFCNDCHDKHSSGAKMEAIPCPGAECAFQKSEGVHRNGPSQDCEQVYSCVLCDSIGNSSGGRDPMAIEPGSPNFLQNPSGEDGLNGWKTPNRGYSWEVEQHSDFSDIPPLLQTPVLGSDDRPPVSSNFVSSFYGCQMTQTIDLSSVLRLGNERNAIIPHVVRLEASARYTGRTDCPSVFGLRLFLHEGKPSAQGQQRQVRTSELLESPPGVYWERASLEIDLDTTGTVWKQPLATVLVYGKDGRGWRGNYGSKVADINLRVVGLNEQEMKNILKPTPSTTGGKLGRRLAEAALIAIVFAILF